MALAYSYGMERYGSRGKQELTSDLAVRMLHRVTQMTRFHQLAEVERMSGNEQNADRLVQCAVHNGIHTILLTESSMGYQRGLDQALAWLAGRDYEMHKTVIGTLDQAKAKLEVERMHGKR